MQRPKVFISSTYHDLIPHREKIWESLSDQDIDILGMEKFGARSSTPLDTCLNEVSICDIYIGIIAYRYGSVDTKSKKSYTQLEYEKAFQLNRVILIYLIDDDCFIQPKFIDFGLKGNKLLKFKSQLKSRHTIDNFKDANDLSIKINTKIHELLPNLPNRFVRPRSISARIHRFKINGEAWNCFIGLLGEKPFEIFTCLADDDMFPIPRSIKNGYISENVSEDGSEYYVFIYTDSFGYTNKLGGLNHKFDKTISQFDRIITNLLRDNTPLSSIFKIIDNLDLKDLRLTEDWKNGVKKALKII